MIIPTSTLPSKGLTTTIQNIDLRPMTYSEIMENGKWRPEDPVDKVIHEIETVAAGIPSYEYLSAYDLKMLVFTRKWISATFGEEISVALKSTGSEYKYKIKVSDITFKDIDEPVGDIYLLNVQAITLTSGTYPFALPTIKQYLETLRGLQNRHIKTDPDTAHLIAALNGLNDIDRVAYAVNNATMEEAAALRSLSLALNNPAKDVTVQASRLNPIPDPTNYAQTDKGKEVAMVNINENIMDIFRFISLNTESPLGKIVVLKELGPGHNDPGLSNDFRPDRNS